MKKKEKLFFFVKRIIEEEKKNSFFVILFKGILFLFSLPVFFFIFLKNFFYDKGIACPVRVSPTVISIGNIVSGGTGKTPFTIYLAKKLASYGHNVAIVSRGYGAKNRKEKVVSISSRERGRLDASILGDEPCEIALRVKDALIVVGRSKIAAAKAAADMNADLILLDDGFQSRRLHRDLDIVLLDGYKPFSNGHVLPFGMLRDSLSSLKRASLIVVTNLQNDSEENIRKITLAIKKFADDVPVIFSQSSFCCFKNFSHCEVFLFNNKIAAFCAIANPKRFYDMLKNRGLEIIFHEELFDHSFFDVNFLKSFSNLAKKSGVSALICTEKDMVKLPKDLSLSLPVYYAEMEHKVIIGEKKLEEILQIIPQKRYSINK